MRFIVDDIDTVVGLMRDPLGATPELPYYDYGHRLEIDNKLKEKSKDSEWKYKKYPLIALRLDTVEDVQELVKFNLNIAILAQTEKNYNSQQRMDNVVRPILAPLYEQFFTALRKSGLFVWPNYQLKPPHKRVIRLYYGTAASEGNIANLFTDPLDAIEIIDLKINLRDNKC